MMHVGDIMSTVGRIQYCGGKIFCYLSTPVLLNPPPPHGTHDIPTCIMLPPTVMSIPHGTEHPTVLKISPLLS